MQVYVKIKALGKRRDVLPSRPYELPEGIASLRQLLTAFVAAEVARFNGKDTEAPLLSCLSVEEIEARAASGKVGFGRLWSGLVRVLMDEAELTELDAPLEVRDGAVFTFVRLTFLAGRMW